MLASVPASPDSPDIEFTATVKAERLRFQEVPRTEIRFSGTPDYESSTVSRRRNLPDRVSEDVDYHDVQIDYLLTNRLKEAELGEQQQSPDPDPDMSPRP